MKIIRLNSQIWTVQQFNVTFHDFFIFLHAISPHFPHPSPPTPAWPVRVRRFPLTPAGRFCYARLPPNQRSMHPSDANARSTRRTCAASSSDACMSGQSVMRGTGKVRSAAVETGSDLQSWANPANKSHRLRNSTDQPGQRTFTPNPQTHQRLLPSRCFKPSKSLISMFPNLSTLKTCVYGWKYCEDKSQMSALFKVRSWAPVTSNHWFCLKIW